MAAHSPVQDDYSFASDNTAGMAPEAIIAFNDANTGHTPSYGDDPWTSHAKKLIASIFETDCEVFFVFNGTGANSLALSAVCRPSHSIICHEFSHVTTDEYGAPEFFSG